MTFDEQFDHGLEIDLDPKTRELLDPEDERRQRFNNLVEVIKDSGSFYMPATKHRCGTPACIEGHCIAHFSESMKEYLDINDYVYHWLLYGHFSVKRIQHITKDEAITVLEMVRDNNVPDNPYRVGYKTIFTID